MDSVAYEAALQLLAQRIDYERAPSVAAARSFKLDRMRRLLALLGNPEKGLPIVHIAGTKGKGSTALMVAQMLTAAGYRTGLFTSPHLTRVEERWMVDGKPAQATDLPALVEAVQPALEQLDREADSELGLGRPTFFELTTAMAFLQFRAYGCTAAILEVGLGGRLDSTNVCQPVVTVITTISYDHTQILGSTLAEIAREKAGIVKAGVPLVTGVSEPEPRQTIEAIARDVGAPCFGVGADFDFRYRPPAAGKLLGDCDYWELRDARQNLSHVALGMHGAHQAANAAVALATVSRLNALGWNIAEPARRQGIGAARCPARVEIQPGPPLVILDAAHNVASVEALLRVLNEELAGRPGRLVFAASSDKDVPGMLQRLVPRFRHVALTQFVRNPRSASLDDLLRWARGAVPAASPPGGAPMPEFTTWNDPQAATRFALDQATPGEFVCIAGSFFLAAEVRDLVCPQ